jgi:hypothetical protein
VTTTALTVSVVNPPIRLFGSDGKTHLEYDLILQSMFNAPVTVTSIEVLAPDGASLLKLDGDQVAKVTTLAVYRAAYGRGPAQRSAGHRDRRRGAGRCARPPQPPNQLSARRV